MQKTRIIPFILLVVISCTKTTYRVALRRADDLHAKAHLPGTLKANDTTYVPVFIGNEKYRLWLAFYQYNIADTVTLDTNFRFVQNHTHLAIAGDTAKYWLVTGSEKGRFKCDDVTLIVRDGNNDFYFQNVTFDYKVD